MVVRWLYIIVFAFPIHHKITHSLPFSPLQILNLSVAAWRNPLGLIRVIYHISSDPHTDTLFWHSFWPISWKYIYIWQAAGIDFLTFFLTFFLAFYLTFYLTYISQFYLAFYLAHILTFFLTVFLASYCDILSDILSLAFYLTYVLRFYLPIFLHLFWHYVRVQARPTAPGARDMARMGSCPQSWRAGTGGGEGGGRRRGREGGASPGRRQVLPTAS